MARARITVDPSGTPGALTEPIELTWWATALSRRFYTAVFAIFGVVFGSLATVFICILYIGVTKQSTKPISPIEYAIVGLAGVFLVGVCMVPVVIVAVLLPAKRGRRYWVKTSDEGITSQPQVGRQRSMCWDEMRLLEVADSSFSLYGRNAIIQWYNTGPTDMVETGTTDEEFSKRHQMLLAMIAARTGLIPRTFSRSLQRGQADTPEHSGLEAEETQEGEDAGS
jgi:hypothetical protein